MSTIDKKNLEFIEKEKVHWKHVLKIQLAGIHYLASHNDAFRRPSDEIDTKNNGKFLSLVETFRKFYLVIKEHLSRIINYDTHVYYLSHDIHENLISLMAQTVKTKII